MFSEILSDLFRAPGVVLSHSKVWFEESEVGRQWFVELAFLPSLLTFRVKRKLEKYFEGCTAKAIIWHFYCYYQYFLLRDLDGRDDGFLMVRVRIETPFVQDKPTPPVKAGCEGLVRTGQGYSGEILCLPVPAEARFVV